MNENDKNVVQYANGFSITASKESGEMLIAFTQNQPVFDEKEEQFKPSEARKVCSIILPYNLGIQMGEIINSAVTQEVNPKTE